MAAALSAMIAIVLAMFSSPVNAADPPVEGQWSAPIDLGGVAIHAALMHTGEVLFFQYVEGTGGVDKTSFVETWNPVTGVRRTVTLPYDRDLFCASHVMLPNGDILLTGGHDQNSTGKQDGKGVANVDTWSPVTRTFTPRPPLSEKRWYPTTVLLANNDAVTFGGQVDVGVRATTVDSYDPATGAMRRLPSSATKAVGQYPQMFAMANGKVLRVTRSSQYFDPATNAWSSTLSTMVASHQSGVTVLLDGATKALTFGGDGTSSAASKNSEILDTAVTTPRWRSVAPMNHGRTLHNGVVLPDGTVLAVGGGIQFKYTSPMKIPELYNPATNTWTDLAPQQGGRMYHQTALLLPDGRVLSAGQDKGTFAKKAEIFSPPYLFKGARPTITTAPSTLGYSEQFAISTPTATDIKSVALVRSVPIVCTGSTVMPGVSIGRRNIVRPLCLGTSVSVRVNKISHLASCAMVVHILAPLITNSSPSRTARVTMDATSLP